MYRKTGGNLSERAGSCFVNDDGRQRLSFPLRLAASLKQRAKLLAREDGVSLNHFISQAVAEKISRLLAGSFPSTTGSRPKELGTRVRCDVTREFTAYSVEGHQPRTIPAGHTVFAIPAPVTGEKDEMEFTWGSVGDIRYRTPRDLFLKSTRH
jgi:HicB family